MNKQTRTVRYFLTSLVFLFLLSGAGNSSGNSTGSTGFTGSTSKYGSGATPPEFDPTKTSPYSIPGAVDNIQVTPPDSISGTVDNIQVTPPEYVYDDAFEQFKPTNWFAFVAGLASMIGVVLTLYQIRVRPQRNPRIRLGEWSRTILLGSGFGILILGSVALYNQPNPPSFVLFSSIYDGLHGISGNEVTDSREHGENVWGFLLFVGAMLVYIGFRHCHYTTMDSISRNALSRGNMLRKQRDRELAAILRNREYVDLSVNERLRHDETVRFYERNINLIYSLLADDSE
jgi:hypothetical protein